MATRLVAVHNPGKLFTSGRAGFSRDERSPAGCSSGEQPRELSERLSVPLRVVFGPSLPLRSSRTGHRLEVSLLSCRTDTMT